MESNWEIDTLFSSHALFGPEGSGDGPDRGKLMQVRNYVVTLRGTIIHEITSLEDKIVDSIILNLDTGQIAGFVAKEHLLSIRESFEKKKQLIKKLHKVHFESIAEEDDFLELDWLQQIRNDFAHGREIVHSSCEHAEIVNKTRRHPLPDPQLVNRFNQALIRWHKILNECHPNQASEAIGTSSADSDTSS